MKMKKILSLTLVLMLLTGLLAGCGAASKGAGIYDSITNEMAMAAPMEPMAPMAEEMGIAQDNSLAQSESDTSAAIPENRKWIITVNISAETEDLDALLALRRRRPECQVLYSVSIGGIAWENTAAELTLAAGDVPELLENISHLDLLTQVEISEAHRYYFTSLTRSAYDCEERLWKLLENYFRS